MIGELTDKEILEFLMTSDFNEKLSPEEAKFLLLKFRYFYRQTYSKNEVLLSEITSKNKKLEDQDIIYNARIVDLSKENKTLSDKINTIMNRKLTLIERISGKITTDKNEPR
jgi:hypothetical protein